MKKLILGTIFLLMGMAVVQPARAEVSVHISVPLPPAIVFPLPPALVVIPETYVYVVPDIAEDIFFYGGWWWRPWDGRWYRSRNYSSGWVHYSRIPSFYSKVPPHWRDNYREHRWKGHEWDQQRIPYRKAQDNWRNWERKRHWETNNYWGVRGMQPRQQFRETRNPREIERPDTGRPLRDGRGPREFEQRQRPLQGREGKMPGRPGGRD